MGKCSSRTNSNLADTPTVTELGWARADTDSDGSAEFEIIGNPDGSLIGGSREIHNKGNKIIIDRDGITMKSTTTTDTNITFANASGSVGRIITAGSGSNQYFALAGSDGSNNTQRIYIAKKDDTIGGHSAVVMFDGVAEFNGNVFFDANATVV